MEDAERRYIDPDLNVLYLGSHDTPRILSRVTQTPGRYCRFADECDSPLPPETAEATPSSYRRLRILWGLLYTARGIPLLYYGDEMALPGGGDPDNRRVLPVPPNPDEINALDVGQSDFFEFLGTLGRIRNQDSALQIGGRITLWENDEQLAYARRTDSAWSVALAQLDPINRWRFFADRGWAKYLVGTSYSAMFTSRLRMTAGDSPAERVASASYNLS